MGQGSILNNGTIFSKILCGSTDPLFNKLSTPLVLYMCYLFIELYMTHLDER